MKRTFFALAAVTAVSATSLIGLSAGPASAAGCASWTATAGTLTVTNVCGPYHTTRGFTPHVHVGGSPTTLSCKNILASSTATWSLSSRVHVDSVADKASC